MSTPLDRMLVATSGVCGGRLRIEGTRITVLQIAAREAGRIECDDHSQLEFATQEGRSIFTFNVGDFARLHREFLGSGQEHAGIITVPRQRYPVGEQVKRLSALLISKTAEEMVNKMVFL